MRLAFIVLSMGLAAVWAASGGPFPLFMSGVCLGATLVLQAIDYNGDKDVIARPVREDPRSMETAVPPDRGSTT